MTKIAITPNASGTGTFTLTSPSSNTDRTFTFPDATGEVLTTAGGTFTGPITGTDLTLSTGVYLGGSTAANLLDDYEVGTFTANLSGSFTYGNREGRYVVIGNTVIVNAFIGWTANASSSVQLSMQMPFTCVAARAAGSFGYVAGIDTQGNKQLTAAMGLGSSFVDLWVLNDNGAPSSVDASACSASGELQVTIAYYIG